MHDVMCTCTCMYDLIVNALEMDDCKYRLPIRMTCPVVILIPFHCYNGDFIVPNLSQCFHNTSYTFNNCRN